jgi:uncharacterized repeat protein (TIGR03803 family)
MKRIVNAYAVFVLCAATAISMPAQTLTTLHSFDGTDGFEPSAPLVQATNGDFYGTTNDGGANNAFGTVFRITATGTLTTLYSFCPQGANCTDGYYPEASGLVQAANGDLYGTTELGGVVPPDTTPSGTVFRITPGGALTTLYSFGSQQGVTGAFPFSGLVQATNGDLYGTTVEGSAGGGAGTIFKITPSGALTTLYTFCAQVNCADGDDPYAPLVQATNGYFYGTTTIGGAYGSGTVFKITPSGTLTTLYNFCAQSECTDGSGPTAGLVQATNGDFYGTTSAGGANNDGTVFRLSVGLGPFVETQTTSGEVGAAVKILGSDLTGASSVTFNGTAAMFTVVSRYLITTTVPDGASTGKVEVVTPSGTLSSNVPFRVLP